MDSKLKGPWMNLKNLLDPANQLLFLGKNSYYLSQTLKIKLLSSLKIY